MYGAPMSRAKASHSSIARSGSGSRLARGVSSWRAAVRMDNFMGLGTKAVTVMAIGLYPVDGSKRMMRTYVDHYKRPGTPTRMFEAAEVMPFATQPWPANQATI